MKEEAKKRYHQDRKEYRRGKRRTKRLPFWGSVLFGFLSVVLVIALIIGTMFDQTFNLMFNGNYDKLTVAKQSADIDSNYFVSDFSSDEERIAAGAQVCERVEGEGAVLLKNENNTLPLEKGAQLSCFSGSSVNIVYGGTGAGAVDSSRAPNLQEALESVGFGVNPTLWDFYLNGPGKDFGRGVAGIMPGPSLIQETPWNVYTEEALSSVMRYGDAAIVVFSRVGGEGSDMATDTCADGENGNYLSLNSVEREMLSNVKAMRDAGTIGKIIVLINSANALEVDFLDDAAYGIDACLWIGDVGQSGLTAVAKILTGDIVPSGHLADTYCKDNLTSPAVANLGAYSYTNAGEITLDSTSALSQTYLVYAEGLYVGYRYYETRYEDYVMGTGNAGAYQYSNDVAYPFGFGMSYTSFEYSDFSAQYNAATDQFDVRVSVTNTGDTYSGKEVVEVYVQSPYTEYDKENLVEKPSVSLCGFAKTEVLKPGQKQEIHITVDRADIASYDAYGAKTYILEEGDYHFAVGANAHDAVNNVLAAKGYTPQNTDGRMDAVGNAAMTAKYTNGTFDKTTYAVSAATGAEITNQLESADLNLYDNGVQAMTYLSRNDWVGTFPKAVTDLYITETMAADLADTRYNPADYDSVDMPTLGAKNGLKLIEMRTKSYDDPAWQPLLDQMTYREMADLVGRGFHWTMPVSSVSAPATRDENGPNGLTLMLMKGSVLSTAFTSKDVLASTWNVDLAAEVGEIIGEDCLTSGFSSLYGPGNNTHRTPYGGRNFEYYSEDGFLAGKISAKETAAIESNGVFVMMKHFALNDGETNRAGVNTWANEQAIREVYLRAFQYPFTQSNASGVMTAYNRFGCIWAGSHEGLLTGILRNEWGADGAFITDNTIQYHYMSGPDAILAGGSLFDAMMTIEHKVFLNEGYDKDPVIVAALREASHRNLYSIVNSNAMNGITVHDSIKAVTPGWMLTLRIATFTALALFVLLVVLTALRSHKYKASHAKPNKKNYEEA